MAINKQIQFLRNTNKIYTSRTEAVNAIETLVTGASTKGKILDGQPILARYKDTDGKVKTVTASVYKASNGATQVTYYDEHVDEVYVGSGTPPSTTKLAVDVTENMVSIVQNTGTGTRKTIDVMSQKAVNDALSTKVGKSDITQSTGTSTTSVMSQKAVSDKLSEVDGKINGSFISQDIFTSDTIPSGINVVFTIIPKETLYNIIVYDASGEVLDSIQSTTATIGQTYTHEYLLPSNYAKVRVGGYGEIDLDVSFECKNLPQLTRELKQHEDTLSSHTNSINTLEQDVETLYDRTTIIGEPIKVDVEPTSVDDNKFLYVNEATPIESSSYIQSIANYNVESFTGKINITATVSSNSTIGYAFIMADESFVMGSGYAKGGSVATHEIEIPQGATILRFSYFIADDISAVVYQKNAQNINEAIAKVEKNTNIALSLAGANATSVSRDTLNNDTLILYGVPSYTKKDCIISFSANVTSFNSTEFGLGYGGTRGLHVTINDTNIIYKTANQQRFSEAHGLIIGSFIRCSVFHALKKYVFVVSTLSGTYFKEFNETDLYFAETYGLPYVYADASTNLTNIKLSRGGTDFNKPVWLFGDSYFSFSVKRWIYHIISYGFTNYMLCGLAGATSQVMYEQLEYCLKFGTPKYIVWCLGMNDGVNSTPYQTYFEKVKALCDSKGIELILQTIPSTPTANKSVINGIVKNSGCRYIDVYSVVGANDSGVWYEGYNDDGVHPTELGAKAIASQVLVDFPEIMQY